MYAGHWATRWRPEGARLEVVVALRGARRVARARRDGANNRGFTSSHDRDVWWFRRGLKVSSRARRAANDASTRFVAAWRRAASILDCASAVRAGRFCFPPFALAVTSGLRVIHLNTIAATFEKGRWARAGTSRAAAARPGRVLRVRLEVARELFSISARHALEAPRFEAVLAVVELRVARHSFGILAEPRLKRALAGLLLLPRLGLARAPRRVPPLSSHELLKSIEGPPMVCCFGLGGGLCVLLVFTPSTQRHRRYVSQQDTGGGGGGGCAAKRSVTSTDVQARACFMCAATPDLCLNHSCPPRHGSSPGSPSRPHPQPARHRRAARNRTPFPHARRERALFNFVRVLDRGALGMPMVFGFREEAVGGGGRLSACLVAACRSAAARRVDLAGARLCGNQISIRPRHRLRRSERQLDDDFHTGRRVFVGRGRRVLCGRRRIGVAGLRCLRRFGVVLVRERVGGELGGGHGFERCPEPTSSYGALSERAAVRVAGRMGAARPFFGGQVLGAVSSRRRARFAASS